MKPSVKTFQKEYFDKSTYQKAQFQNLVHIANWGHFCSQTCAEGKFTVFNNGIENAPKMSKHQKKLFLFATKKTR